MRSLLPMMNSTILSSTSFAAIVVDHAFEAIRPSGVSEDGYLRAADRAAAIGKVHDPHGGARPGGAGDRAKLGDTP